MSCVSIQCLPGFLAVSTLMIYNVYCQLGHGTEFVDAWSRHVFMLAAVLYVEDLDLLHMPRGFQPMTNI